MNERSFIFNNRSLSDLGMMICYFDSVDNIETVESLLSHSMLFKIIAMILLDQLIHLMMVL